MNEIKLKPCPFCGGGAKIVYFCYNDNFISLWEMMWNYNQEENSCYVVEVIGNIYDNPELLEVKQNEM